MARGKVGDLVFYVRNGAQQTRVRNRQPENPRSRSQMNQRVKLASVVGFYKRQASFFRFALKKSQKESYYNAFVRYNINISPYLTKEDVANGVTIPAPYVIADGDMPRVVIGSSNITSSGTLSLRTDILSTMNTWGDMRRQMDLQMGDMLSIVVFNATDDELDPAQRIVCQHVFDTQSENMPIGYDMTGCNWYTVDGLWNISMDPAYFGVAEFYATGSAIVMSRNNGQVECSYAKLLLNNTARVRYENKRSDEARAAAAASYGVEKNAVLDPKQFEGNYVDMAKLYSSPARTEEISSVKITSSEGTATVYVSPQDSRITNIEATLISGDEVADNFSWDGDTFSFELEGSAEDKGTGLWRLDFNDASANTLHTTVLTVTVQY